MFRSLILSLVAVAGCAKKASETAAPEARGMSGAFEDDIDAIERELAGREAQLRSIGVATPARLNAVSREEAEALAGADVSPSRDETKAAGATPAAEAQVAPTSAPAPTERPAEPPSRCETVCSLSASICQLESRICDLVPRHAGEPRYQAACERAAADCATSTEACHACS